MIGRHFAFEIKASQKEFLRNNGRNYVGKYEGTNRPLNGEIESKLGLEEGLDRMASLHKAILSEARPERHYREWAGADLSQLVSYCFERDRKDH